MKSTEIREKYLKFFEKLGHVRIDPSPLVLENDPTTLFTSSGMQQLVPYLKGGPHPKGKRLVNSQPSLRLQDIEEVGDNRHTTFFEMLGNWSLGDYFKKEQLPWIWEFFTKELGLPADRLWVSVFEGTKEVPKDTESIEIWKKIGVSQERIFEYGVGKNWWSRSGTPEDMPKGEIGGPDSEIFYDFDPDGELKIHENYSDRARPCHPSCECGRFLEIGNSVFIQYQKNKDGTLSELPQKNVDFGGGLERIAAAVNNDPDIFQIDIYKPIVSEIEKITGKSYEEEESTMRIVADHLRAASALATNGIVPDNKLQGYVMRRLVRRAVVKMRNLKSEISDEDFRKLIREDAVVDEVERFKKTLENGLKEVEKIEKINGKTAFFLYETYGFPVELTEEIAKEKGQSIDKKEFKTEFEKHKELSRTASAGMFKGGLADHSTEVTKLHTATHLLHAALRKILGEHVSQKGSNITVERLRFDFSHPQRLSEVEVKKVEDLVNEQISADLPVSYETKTLDEAIAEGALQFFGERYGEKVKVYKIGPFSREVCGGPHVSRTGELGRARIIKQEKVGAQVVRLYAVLES